MNAAKRPPPSSEPTLIAVLTPPGRQGAVATLGVRGPRAVEIVAKRFASLSGQPLTAFPVGRVLFGRFRLSGGATEELVVGLVAADEVEVHSHGGLAAVEAVAAALVAEGAERIEWPAGAAHHTARFAGDRGTRRSRPIPAPFGRLGVLLDQYRAHCATRPNIVSAVGRGDFIGGLCTKKDHRPRRVRRASDAASGASSWLGVPMPARAA